MYSGDHSCRTHGRHPPQSMHPAPTIDRATGGGRGVWWWLAAGWPWDAPPPRKCENQPPLLVDIGRKQPMNLWLSEYKIPVLQEGPCGALVSWKKTGHKFFKSWARARQKVSSPVNFKSYNSGVCHAPYPHSSSWFPNKLTKRNSWTDS